jgi:hypothetical protein
MRLRLREQCFGRCHLLVELGSAIHHPQKRHIPRQAGQAQAFAIFYLAVNICVLKYNLQFITYNLKAYVFTYRHTCRHAATKRVV